MRFVVYVKKSGLTCALPLYRSEVIFPVVRIVPGDHPGGRTQNPASDALAPANSCLPEYINLLTRELSTVDS